MKNNPQDALVVVNSTEDEKKIQTYIEEFHKGKLKLKPRFVCFDEEKLSSCEILLRVREYIESPNFFLLVGNVLADPFLISMADVHRAKEPVVTLALKDKKTYHTKSPIISSGNVRNTEFVALLEEKEVHGAVAHQRNTRSVLSYHSIDLNMDNNNIQVQVPKRTLRKFPNLRLYSGYTDVGVYIFSTWVLDLLEEKIDTLKDIKQDLVPYLVNNQTLTKYSSKSFPAFIPKNN